MRTLEQIAEVRGFWKLMCWYINGVSTNSRAESSLERSSVCQAIINKSKG